MTFIKSQEDCNTKAGNFLNKYKKEKCVKDKMKKAYAEIKENDNEYNELYNYEEHNERDGFVQANQTRKWNGKFNIIRSQQKEKAFIRSLVDSDQYELTKDYLKSAVMK